MNIQQLEYIIAVDNCRHFAKASERCFVTQATLSMMIKKLEEELDVKIFDRSKQPVVPTEIGKKIIAQARRAVSETAQVKELIREERGEVSGEIRLGIIPTIATYLLPLFLKEFILRYPQVKLVIHEHTTKSITRLLKSGKLDVGIMVTPLHSHSFTEKRLFYERYFLYTNDHPAGFDAGDLKDDEKKRLLLVHEGYCMHSHLIHIGELKQEKVISDQIRFKTGSIETLRSIVEKNLGATVIPELATLDLNDSQKDRLQAFKSPPREISMVTYGDFIRTKLLEVLSETILAVLPDTIKANQTGEHLANRAVFNTEPVLSE